MTILQCTCYPDAYGFYVHFFDRRVRLLAIQADATKRETHAYKHAELRAADDNCTFKPQINKSSKQRHARSVEELSRGDAAHNLDLKVSERTELAVHPLCHGMMLECAHDSSAICRAIVVCAQEELEKQNILAEQRTLTFKPSVNSSSVSVPGRLQLHTKEGLESYLDRIKVCCTPMWLLLRCDCAVHDTSHDAYFYFRCVGGGDRYNTGH